MKSTPASSIDPLGIRLFRIAIGTSAILATVLTLLAVLLRFVRAA